MAVAIVAVVRINAHLRTFSVVEIAFVHWAAWYSSCRKISYSSINNRNV